MQFLASGKTFSFKEPTITVNFTSGRSAFELKPSLCSSRDQVQSHNLDCFAATVVVGRIRQHGIPGMTAAIVFRS